MCVGTCAESLCVAHACVHQGNATDPVPKAMKVKDIADEYKTDETFRDSFDVTRDTVVSCIMEDHDATVTMEQTMLTYVVRGLCYIAVIVYG